MAANPTLPVTYVNRLAADAGLDFALIVSPTKFEQISHAQTFINDLVAKGVMPNAALPVTQAEAEAGTATALRMWTPQRIAQAIAALAPAPNLSGYVTAAQLTALINGAPSTLDTLKELADAVNDDPSFATKVLLKASNLSDLGNAATARTNLGLGSAATVNKSTIGGALMTIPTPPLNPTYLRLNTNGTITQNIAPQMRTDLSPVINSFDGYTQNPWTAPGSTVSFGDLCFDVRNGEVWMYVSAIQGYVGNPFYWMKLDSHMNVGPSIHAFETTADDHQGGGPMFFTDGATFTAGTDLVATPTIYYGYPTATETEGNWYRLDGSNEGVGTNLGNGMTITMADEGYQLQYRVQVSNNWGTANSYRTTAPVPAQEHLLANLVAYWNFENTLYAVTGPVFTMQNSSGPSYSSGATGNSSAALQFDGTGYGNLNGGTIQLQPDSSKPVTIAFWSFAPNDGSSYVVMQIGEGTNCLTITRDGSSQMNATLYTPDGGNNITAYLGNTDNTWTLWVVTLCDNAGGDNTRWQITLEKYIGGSLQGSNASSEADFSFHGGNPLSPSHNFAIGADNTGSQAFPNLQLDDMGIWNRQLRDADKTALANDTQYGSFHS